MRCFLFAAAGLAAAPAALAQSSPQLGAWYVYSLSAGAEGSPWTGQIEAQSRNHDMGRDLDAFLLRGAVRYALPNAPVTLAAGAARFHSEDEGVPDNAEVEVRLFQDAVVRSSVMGVGVDHRFRVEERWVGDDPFQTRFRYQVAGTVPLNGRSASDAGAVFGVASSEVFLRGPGRGDREVLDRVRVAAGVGVRLLRSTAFQVGYLGQIYSDEVEHRVEVRVSQTFRF